MKTDLQKIPGVGKNIERHLLNIGYDSIESLKGQNPGGDVSERCSFQRI